MILKTKNQQNITHLGTDAALHFFHRVEMEQCVPYRHRTTIYG